MTPEQVAEELSHDSQGVRWSTPQMAHLADRLAGIGDGIDALQAENELLRAALAEAHVLLLNRDKGTGPIAEERQIWGALADIVASKVAAALEPRT